MSTFIPRSTTYYLKHLDREPGSKEDWPRIRIRRPSDGQRSLLKEMTIEATVQMQAQLDAIPEAVRKAMMTEDATETADVLEAPVMAATAVSMRLQQPEDRLYMLRAALLMRGIAGDWSCVDEDLEGVTVPPVDPDDPEPGLEARCKAVFGVMDAMDVDGLLAEVAAFVKAGGAGLTESQEGNSEAPSGS